MRDNIEKEEQLRHLKKGNFQNSHFGIDLPLKEGYYYIKYMTKISLILRWVHFCGNPRGLFDQSIMGIIIIETQEL